MQGQCLGHEFAQGQLVRAFGGGIYRGEVRFRLLHRFGVEHLVFRMHHFQTRGAQARLAETAHTAATPQVRLLRGGEMKKAQGDMAGAVADAA